MINFNQTWVSFAINTISNLMRIELIFLLVFHHTNLSLKHLLLQLMREFSNERRLGLILKENSKRSNEILNHL